MSNNSGVYFLTGLAAGVAVGILFAPHTGVETRDLIGRKAEEGKSALREEGLRLKRQAMAMRRPVVASRAGGPLEIIEDGRTGFLVPPGDEGALASRVITLLEDRALSARITEAAYQDVERRFSPDIHAQKVQRVYETVLRTEPHQRPGTPR